MEHGFLGDHVKAKMPVFSSGDVMIDLLLGEEKNCAFRALTQEEISQCRVNGQFYFRDEGIDIEAEPPSQVLALNIRGKVFGEELYRRKYWPKPLQWFCGFCETVSSLIA